MDHLSSRPIFPKPVPERQEVLSGNGDYDTEMEDRRDSNVIKQETVPPEEKQEDWFDSVEDEYFDCQMPEVWYECNTPPKDKWHDCRQIPVKKQPRPNRTEKFILTAYPCVLMMLSFMMLPMHTVELILRLCGLRWRERQEHFYSVFQFPFNSFKALKLYWWPPPKSATRGGPKSATRGGMNRKKLLITALSMAMMRANAAAPPMTWSADRRFLQTIKRAKGRNGMLMTARL
jgi:hypothetical protein